MDFSSSAPQRLGRYLLYGEIGSGGMAAVYFGRMVGAGGFARPVAIKRLHAQFARDPAFVKMLLDEGRLGARIQHPNVVPTLDVVTQNGEVFVVMEYVPGINLSHLIRLTRRSGRRIPLTIAASIVAGMLQGLHAAHEAKDEDGAQLEVVHRDVSPQNALIGTDGVSRLIDFGIAKAAGRLHSTRDGELKGKLAYMAPEQVRGEPVTRRTDVYGAAIILWETLTSQRLFHGDNEAHLLSNILSFVPPPPSSVAPEVPPSLDATVLRGLQRCPTGRFASAREMAAEIQACVAVATPMEISDWLQATAGDVIRERCTRVEAAGREAPLALGDPAGDPGDVLCAQAVTVVAGRSSKHVREPSIALFLRALDNDYQYAQREDALNAARRLGLSLHEAVAHNDSELQRMQIEESLRKPADVRPRVFLVNPVDEGALQGVALDAARAGVGWVSINRSADYLDELRLEYPDGVFMSVSPDQRQIGRIQGRLLRAHLARGARVLYIEGPRNTSSARLRREATQDELAHAGIELDIESADWTVEGGASAARRWLSRSRGSRRAGAVCAQNDGMAVGARTVLLADAEPTTRLVVIGCDGTAAYGRRLVEEGVLDATVVIPATAGRAVQEIAMGGAGTAMPANVIIPVHAFPPGVRDAGRSVHRSTDGPLRESLDTTR